MIFRLEYSKNIIIIILIFPEVVINGSESSEIILDALKSYNTTI